MTRTTNARLAGFTYLFYIAVAFPSMVLFDRATSGTGIAAKLASIAQHASDVRVAVVLSLLGCFSALVLAVGEGVLGAASLRMPGLLWLATAGAGAGAPDVAAANAIGAFLLIPSGSTMIGATFFAVGSTLFSYLLMRARTVPVPLARLGILASVLLVVALPLQLAGVLKGPVTWYMWMPMLVFEVVLALWLLIKGVAMQATR